MFGPFRGDNPQGPAPQEGNIMRRENRIPLIPNFPQDARDYLHIQIRNLEEQEAFRNHQLGLQPPHCIDYPAAGRRNAPFGGIEGGAPALQQQENLTFTPNMVPFLESSELSDVILQSKEGDRFPAHRLVLSASSDVFRTMFSSDMRERAEGIVEIGDIGTKALRLMLKFIYVGNFKEEEMNLKDYDLDLFWELVRVGDKYNLPLLMKHAGLGLSRCVTKENAMEVFLELKNYGEEMKEARSQIAGFIEKNVRDMV